MVWALIHVFSLTWPCSKVCSFCLQPFDKHYKVWSQSLGECVSVSIVSDHMSECTFLDSNWAKGNLDTFKTVTCWHIISSILDSAALSHKAICKRAIVNHCPRCQSLIQVREFNSAPVRLFQWPICSEIKLQTIGGGATNSNNWCEQRIMRVLEWAWDYKRITRDNLPRGSSCKDFFFFHRSFHKTASPMTCPFSGGGISSSGWHRPLCRYRLAWSDSTL